MKLLYITDSHLTAKSPSGRIDSYPMAALLKLMELGNVIQSQQVDYVIHGGDLFHTPKISLKYAGIVMRVIRSWGVPIYVVPGNHDLYGYEVTTLDQTMLGLFEKSGIITVLKKDNPIYLEVTPNYTVGIQGQEYFDGIDLGPSDAFQYTGDIYVEKKILILHANLLENAGHPDMDHTVIEPTTTNADIVCLGHYHPGISHISGGRPEPKLYTSGQTSYVAPGSMMRIEASAFNKDATPHYAILGFEPDPAGVVESIEFKPLLCAVPGQKIFDYGMKQTKKTNVNVMNQFKQIVANAATLKHATTVADMLKAIAQTGGIDQSVLNEAASAVAQAQVMVDEESLLINGYVEKGRNIRLSRVEIDNFQSIAHAVVDFTDGMNVVVGETNNGKSALFRAIYFALRNEPKGSGFIRTGESACKVKLTFDDGESLTRSRTTSDAGEYILDKADGTSVSLKGFAQNLPIAIANMHQMPTIKLNKDLTIDVMISEQLAQPFLVTETGNAKATMIGRLIGVDAIDIAIKNMNRQSLGIRKDLTVANSTLAKKEAMLKDYDDLPDIDVKLKTIDGLLADYALMEKEHAELKAYDAKLKAVHISKLSESAQLKAMGRLDEAIAIQAKALLLHGEIKDLGRSAATILQIRNDLLAESKRKHMLSRIDPESLLANIKNIFTDLNTISASKAQRLTLYKEIRSTVQAMRPFACLDTSIRALETARKLKDDLSAVGPISDAMSENLKQKTAAVAARDKTEKTLDAVTGQRRNASKELEDYTHELGVCPLCNKPF